MAGRKVTEQEILELERDLGHRYGRSATALVESEGFPRTTFGRLVFRRWRVDGDGGLGNATFMGIMDLSLETGDRLPGVVGFLLFAVAPFIAVPAGLVVGAISTVVHALAAPIAGSWEGMCALQLRGTSDEMLPTQNLQPIAQPVAQPGASSVRTRPGPDPTEKGIQNRGRGASKQEPRGLS